MSTSVWQYKRKLKIYRYMRLEDYSLHESLAFGVGTAENLRLSDSKSNKHKMSIINFIVMVSVQGTDRQQMVNY